MKQSAADIPEHTLQRKAAIATGSVRDYAGQVTVSQIPDFDLNRTIFNTLEGRLPRFVMRTRIAKDVKWSETHRDLIERAYQTTASEASTLPAINPELLAFMVNECDFDVEHADGSFLDHLYFCYEYTHHHLPGRSALVMLLHSILGTGTNTFAMTADKIPALKALVDAYEWSHIESFPSALRLLYDGGLRAALRQNIERLDQLKCIKFHRVIDNEPIELSADNLWLQLNYQLIHFVDFLPVSNWTMHANDTSLIVFKDLYDILERSGRLEAKVEYVRSTRVGAIGESRGLGAKLVSMIPVGLSERMASKSIRQFSQQIGHSLEYELEW